MTHHGITFIGGGNMATSLVGGLIADHYPAERITVTDPAADRREWLSQRFGIRTAGDNRAAIESADVVVLAVKPQVMHEVIAELAATLEQRRPLVVSIAAGVRESDISRWLGYRGPVVRCMPNTPALLQSGVSVLYPNAQVEPAQRDIAESILRAVGTVIWIDDEALMNTVTAISGSGPAYFFRFMEAMEDAAVVRGLEREKARLLVIETALGAARMALESDDDPGQLRANVTSKGGTTAAALEAFEQGELGALVDRAVGAAHDRSVELGEQLGADE